MFERTCFSESRGDGPESRVVARRRVGSERCNSLDNDGYLPPSLCESRETVTTNRNLPKI